MYVQIRLCNVGDDNQPRTFNVNCRSVNEDMDEIRDRVRRRLQLGADRRVRLFFDGKEVRLEGDERVLWLAKAASPCIIYVI